MKQSNPIALLILLSLLSVILGGCAREAVPPQALPPQVEPTNTESNALLPPSEPRETDMPAVDDIWSEIDPSGQQIIFWHIFDGEREKALAELVNEFNGSNPHGIQVQALNQGSYVDIFNRMLEAINAGSPPDVLVAFQNQAAVFGMSEGIIDLSSLVDSPIWGYSEAERQAFFPGVWQSDLYPSMGGQRLGIPFYRSVDLVYYNADWLEALGFTGSPTTPDQFIEMACAASANPFHPELSDQSTGALFFPDASRLAAWTFAFGGDLYDVAGLRFQLNNDIVKGAVNFQTRLITDGCARQSPTWDYDQEQFVAGKTLFMMGSSNLIAYFTELEQTGALNFRWDVAAYPHLTPAPLSNSYGVALSIGNNSPERELAAFLFIKYLTSPETQLRWSAASGNLPVISGIGSDAGQLFNDRPAYKTAYDLLANSKSEPSLAGYDFVRKEIEDAVSAILEGGDVNAIMEALNEKANLIIAEQGVQ